MRAQLASLVAFAFLVVSSSLFAGEKEAEEARAQLLSGVQALPVAGSPGNLCVFGEDAFAVVVGASGEQRDVVVAASTLGTGRVLAFAHTSYLDPTTLARESGWTFAVNALRWAGRSPDGKLSIAVYRNAPLAHALQERGFDVVVIDSLTRLERKPRVDVVCAAPSDIDEEELAALTRYVRTGGGAMLAATGWGWQQLNPARSLVTDNRGNLFLASAGLMWGRGFAGSTGPAGFVVEGQALAFVHVQRALDAFAATEAPVGFDARAAQQAAHTLISAARLLPRDDKSVRTKLERLRLGKTALVPSAEAPLGADRALDRLLVALELEELERTNATKIKAHPAAATFPGAVAADAPRVLRSLTIGAGREGWQGTGLYAAPGEVIEVSIPLGEIGHGWRVQIGAHTDELDQLASWKRVPRIVQRTALQAETTRAASAFGGLVFVLPPHPSSPTDVVVRIRGAVEAPRFVLGETNEEQWRARIRLLAAPWGELVGKRVALCLPSTTLAKLDNPAALMEFWDRVLDVNAQLAQIPAERARPERFVPDVQISAGYMHSGYPIMTHLDVADTFADLPRLSKNDAGCNWGFFHELGHNHQADAWTFEGAVEVTCNLFTLYTLHKVCGVAVADDPRFVEAARAGAWAEQVNQQVKTKNAFERWQADPFLALLLYVDLQEGFGWEAYQRVFSEYRALAAAERPVSDEQKRDQFMVRFSRTVGHDLSALFTGWGVPTTEGARNSIADLPPWLPKGRAR